MHAKEVQQRFAVTHELKSAIIFHDHVVVLHIGVALEIHKVAHTTAAARLDTDAEQ